MAVSRLAGCQEAQGGAQPLPLLPDQAPTAPPADIGAAAPDVFGPLPLPPPVTFAPAPSPPSGFGLAPGIGTPSGEPRLRYQGVATVAYATEPISPYQAVTLGCGLGYVSPTFQSNYVGVSPDIYAKAAACGRCIQLQCDDASCREPGRKLPALVVDLCGSCTATDLSISTPMFQNLTGRVPGSNPSIVTSWDIVPCGPYTEGTVKMLLKQGGQAFYQAFGFSNAAVPIEAVQVNGTRLQLGSDNYWQWNPGSPINPAAPLQILLAGANGQVLRATVPSLRSADLGVQFKS